MRADLAPARVMLESLIASRYDRTFCREKDAEN
jgi:hypothetical protein